MIHKQRKTANNSRTIKVNLPSETPVGAGAVATNDTTSLEQHKNKMIINQNENGSMETHNCYQHRVII